MKNLKTIVHGRANLLKIKSERVASQAAATAREAELREARLSGETVDQAEIDRLQMTAREDEKDLKSIEVLLRKLDVEERDLCDVEQKRLRNAADKAGEKLDEFQNSLYRELFANLTRIGVIYAKLGTELSDPRNTEKTYSFVDQVRGLLNSDQYFVKRLHASGNVVEELVFEELRDAPISDFGLELKCLRAAHAEASRRAAVPPEVVMQDLRAVAGLEVSETETEVVAS